MQRALEPEDLASEVFIGVFRGLSRFDGSEQKFRSWVFTIAHRRLLDERRDAARRPHLTALDHDAGIPGGDVEREAMASLGDQWVIQMCGQLSSDQRTVLLLRVIADLSTEDVAQVTGKSVGAVKALQRRALTTLRRLVGKESVPL